ncbi:MAG: GxxExxY protein [Pirellulales bacterium]
MNSPPTATPTPPTQAHLRRRLERNAVVYWEKMNRQDAKDAKGDKIWVTSRRVKATEPSRRVDELTSSYWCGDRSSSNSRAGFLESVYEEALAIELTFAELYSTPFALMFKGRNVGDSLDFLVDNLLVVELKAVEAIHPIYPAKVIHYLKMSNLELGLIINFHVVLLKTASSESLTRP